MLYISTRTVTEKNYLVTKTQCFNEKLVPGRINAYDPKGKLLSLEAQVSVPYSHQKHHLQWI